MPGLGTVAFPFAIVGLVLGVIALVGASRGVREGKAATIAATLLCVLSPALGSFWIVVTDYDPHKHGKMVATLRNKSTKNAAFSVEVEALDTNGQRIADDTAFVDALAPGQAIQKDMFVFVTSDKYDAMSKATFKVIQASKYTPIPPPTK